MRQHGWTQRELERQLGMPEGWVAQVIRGEKDGGIADMMRRLPRVGWEVVIRPKRERLVKRRKFPAAAPSVAFVPSARIPPYQDPEYVRALATRLSTGLYERGGVFLLPFAFRYGRCLQPALTSTDRALQSAASDTVTWAAWVANDNGRYDVADHLGRLALALGERAGDQNAQAAAYSALAGINTDRNRLDKAVMYAQRGAALPAITPERRAWLNLRLGQALALSGGREHAARNALTQARSFVAEIRDTADAADLTNGIGEALSDLRAFHEAQACLDEAVRLGERFSPLEYGRGVALQAQTALRAADPLAAAERMVILARAAPLTPSSWIDKKVRDILSLSDRWRHVPEIRFARGYLSSVAPVGRS